MDVTLSVGFLRGIVAQESSKHAARGGLYESGAYDQDGVRAIITAIVPEKSIINGGNITSAPLEAAESVGRKKVYTAMFPLKGGKVSSSVTIPGLLQGDQRSSRNMPYGHRIIKPQPIDLLISIMFQNERMYLGKATILATGEEIRTKQIDLPIDVARDSIIRTQKKSSIGKRAPSITADRHGDVAPTAFKYDPTRRKYKIERDGLLRVFIKALPANTRSSRSHSQPTESRPGRGYPQQLKSSPSDIRGSRSRSQQPTDPRSSRSYSQQPTDSRPSRSYPQQQMPIGTHDIIGHGPQTRDPTSTRRSPSMDGSRSSSRRSETRRSSSANNFPQNNYSGPPSIPDQSMRSGAQSLRSGAQSLRSIPAQNARSTRSSSRTRSQAGIPHMIEPQASPPYRPKSSQTPQRSMSPQSRSRSSRSQSNSRPQYSVGGYPESVAPSPSVRTPAASVRSAYTREMSTRSGPPRQIRTAGEPAVSVYGASTYGNSAEPRGIPQRAHSVPRMPSGPDYDGQNSYAGSSYRGQPRQRERSQPPPPQAQQYGYGDNSTIGNSTYRRESSSGAPSYPTSQSQSRHGGTSQARSQTASQPQSRSSRSQTHSRSSRSQPQPRSQSRSRSQSQSRSNSSARPRPRPGDRAY